MKTLSEYLAEGDLQAAIEAIQSRVKANPGQVSHRFELAELLLLSGAFERADTHFDLVSTQDPSFGVRVALIRQLIRAEYERREVFEGGRTPEVLGELDPEVEIGLRILLEQRAGGPAAEMRREADEATGDLAGEVDGRAVNLVRDLDDRVADVLEVLTSTGKYYWVPFKRVRSLELHPPTHPRDIIWREATLDVENGPEGVVYIPTTYHSSSKDLSDALKLGRATEWIDVGGLTQGEGQRCLVLGEDLVSFGDFNTLLVDRPAGQ